MILSNLPLKSVIRKSLFILLSLICVLRASAFEISGTVVSATSGKPIEFAGAFLSNTSIGMLTSEHGTFVLKVNNPGMYQLVITHMGYQTYALDLQINADVKGLVIKMNEKSHPLSTLVVTPKSDREKYYEIFVKEFIGASENAEDCKIENPLVINFLYSDEDQSLEAFADTFIVITNKALGYSIKYKLEHFKTIPGETVFYGFPLFEEISKKYSKRKTKKITESRIAAYHGSPMHFFRTLYADSLLSAHFVAYKLEEKPRKLLSKKFFYGDTIKHAAQKDSLRKLGRLWLSKENMTTKVFSDSMAMSKEQVLSMKEKGFIFEDIAKIPMDVRMNASVLNNPNFVDNKKSYLSMTKDTIPLFSFVSDTIGQMKTLKFNRPFQIKYTAAGEEDNYIKERYRGEDQQAYARKLHAQSSFVILKTGKLVFDANGSYTNVDDFFMGGYIGWRKVATMLPIDYVPVKQNTKTK